jgi:hypothetical protein
MEAIVSVLIPTSNSPNDYTATDYSRPASPRGQSFLFTSQSIAVMAR